MDFATKADLLDAVFAAILQKAKSNFPERAAIAPEFIAHQLNIKFHMEDRGGYGKRAVFSEFFGQKFDSIVRTAVLWLAESDFLFTDPANPATLATLSERGARLMGCLPKCLGE